MIRLLLDKGEADRLDPSSLVGLIILRAGAEVWPSVAWPMRVIENRGPRGHKLIVRPVPYQFVPADEDGPAFHSYRPDWEQPGKLGHTTLTVVRAICDTPQEAMKLLDHSLRCKDEFLRWHVEKREELLGIGGKRDWMVLKQG